MKKALSVLAILSLVFSPVTPAFALARISTADNEIWAGTGVPNAATTDVTEAVAGDNVNIGAFILDVTNDQTADDGTNGGGDLNNFTIGALTGTTGSVNVYTVNIIAEPAATDLNATIDSVTLTGAGTFDLSNADTDGINGYVNVTNGFDIAGNLNITNNEATNDVRLRLRVFGDFTVDGTTTITSNAGAGGGADAGVALEGSTVTGNFTLDDSAGGTAWIGFDSDTGAQTITSDIDGGTVYFWGDGPTTLTGDLGLGTQLTMLEADAGGFTHIIIGDIDAALLSFRSDDILEVNGTVSFGTIENNTGGDDIGTLTVNGGTTTVTGDVGLGGLNTLHGINVDGTGALLDLQGNNAVTAINFGGAATVQLADGFSTTTNVTNTISNQGTLTFLGAHTFVGDIGSTGVGLNLVTVGNNVVDMTGDIFASTVNLPATTH